MDEIITDNGNEVKTFLLQGKKQIKYKINLDMPTRIQLFLTGKSRKGVELYGIGLPEMRGFAFMFSFAELINYAVGNNYKVFVIKENDIYKKSNWYLKFMNQM